jgi:BirA family biotin operon repressor/biotin-[acetyl-CoA-carboxylase] ligase
MDQPSLESALADLPISAIRFFSTLDSTNDEGWRWIDAGIAQTALVVADEQTAGRGRNRRRWVTVAGRALAFSLVLAYPQLEPQHIQRLTGLGALATCQALSSLYDLPAEIKWPNDILLRGRKVGGILAETRWQGEALEAAVVGIGINIAPESISPQNLPVEKLNFPVTCVEAELGFPVERLVLLHEILEKVFHWIRNLASPEFLSAWEAKLAYRNQWVELSVVIPPHSAHDQAKPNPRDIGKVIGLDFDGALKLLSQSGKLTSVQVGEVQLKPHRPGHT